MVKLGDFSFAKNSSNMLKDAYDAINETNTWNEMVEYPNISDDKLNQIHKLMKHYELHSGASYSWTMQAMKYIAKNGWDNYISFIQQS
jgi:hypothetical protein